MSVGDALRQMGRANLGRIGFVVAVALLILGWNIYITYHDDGIVAGRVVDEAGRPVSNATVHLREETLNLLKQPVVTESDERGRFRYEGIDMIAFVLTAQKEGYRKSKRYRYHLYFKGQNFEADEPIVLEATTPGGEAPATSQPAERAE